MPGSLVSNHIHIIFSTRDRANMILDEYKEQIYNLIAGVAKDYHCPVRASGGTNNHIHMLLSLHQDCRLSYVVRDCMIASSRWIHEQGGVFEWPTGYAAFSVGQHELMVISDYIRRQEDHHIKQSYDEELHKIIHFAGINYKPEYLYG